MDGTIQAPALRKQCSGDFTLTTDLGDKLISNNSKTDAFIMVHESPKGGRRQLRSSKELNETDKAALAELLISSEGDNTASIKDDSTTSPHLSEEHEDEVGAFVMPSPPHCKSYKNGRRLNIEAAAPAATSLEVESTMKADNGDSELKSPTGVLDTFFGGILGKTAGNSRGFLEGLV
uniref:Uncharacterized protein n=1 Tax=Haptolina brevifila TaxID=156173 RepID=A0A7S2FG89_9EUKA